MLRACGWSWLPFYGFSRATQINSLLPPLRAHVCLSHTHTHRPCSLTGESDEVPKDPVHSPFLLAGTNVTSGNGAYLVTAVGVRSLQGSIMKDASSEAEETPLQQKLDDLATKVREGERGGEGQPQWPRMRSGAEATLNSQQRERA